MSSLAGRDFAQTLANRECMMCDTPNMEFKDQLSIKEYTIGGMCQDCQDGVFGGEEQME